MKRLLIYIILLFLSLQLFAQKNAIQFKKLDINNGLSSNQINTIYKDTRGYLWIGTVNGLDRYDGYSSRTFRKSADKPGSIINNTINRIFEDNRKRLIIVTAGGLSVFDPVKETFSDDDSIFHKNIEIPKTGIVEIFTDKKNNLWIINRNSGIYKYDPKIDKVSHAGFETAENPGLMPYIITGASFDSEGSIWTINQGLAVEKFDIEQFKVIKRFKNISSSLTRTEFDHGIFIDSEENVWIFSRDEQEGVLQFNSVTEHFTIYSAESNTNRISNNIITSVIEDATGNILVGTDHGGLNLIDKKTRIVHTCVNDPGEKNSIAQNSITCLFRDNTNIIWVGTYKKGISYYHPDLFKFSAYTQHPYRKNWLEYEDVNTFAEDKYGNLWIGTNGGGLIYFDRGKNTFKSFKHNPSDRNSLSSDVIVDVCIDHEGGLWIGTYMGGLNYFDGKKFTRFLNDPNNTNSISHNNIWSIYEDSDRQLWIGTLGSGVDLYDREMKRFIHHRPGSINSVHSNYIMSISENIDKNIWFATANGVDLLEKASGRFFLFSNNPGTNSLISNSTLDIFCDHRGWVWIATREGLNMYNPATQKFILFNEENGLSDSNILTVLEDDKGNMWVGTPQGLCNIILTVDLSNKISYSVKNYDEKDGLHGKEFNEHAALKTRKGELIFGGADGFSIFKPENLTSVLLAPSIVFTGLDVQNKPIELNQIINKRVLLPKSLNYIDQISLKYFEKTFSISFAALNFINPEKTLYHYKMEGFNSDWVATGSSSRKITYTNLHPNEYIFRVYASDIDNSLKSGEITLHINILPPFWKTKWAFSLYLILTLLIIFYSVQVIIRRERNKFLIQQERIKTAKVHEMDLLKLKFFTNISHEFRTPLTLILSPLERIIKTTENRSNKEQLKLIQRNAKRLLNLINQLLDFRRLEVQGLTLVVREEELVNFCKEATESFSDLSESRNIQLTFTSNVEELKASFDYDKVEKILFNLLSNAFKFTPEGGKISVNVYFDESNSAEKFVKIEVCDTGIGIPDDKKELIFERFVQNLPEGATVNRGSGIGLSLTREFVQMHDGKISVISTVGVGSCFEVILPLKKSFEIHKLSGESVLIETKLTSFKNRFNVNDESLFKSAGILKLLLVEDNPDILFYLKDNLKADYQILEASNGIEAWELTLKAMPDIIVSDIMMPVMDGLEFCRKIKTDNRTSHVPVILLTAKTTDQQMYEGLETGADDYITKPFNFEILELRIKTLIAQRQKLRLHYQQNFDLQPSEISITSLDDKFLKKIKEITENNMHEPNFSVEKLSTEFGISRAHLYNKLVALTGKTPIEFIRILRIRRSAQLLEKSQLTVMEIAYKVGFNDPRYFTKHFKSEYKMTPSQYAKKYFKPSTDISHNM
jgi:signal transduction histidine kinase/ligand-binding sensor domain-containing protein/DNA-binding response OmpR family regulator